MYLLQRNDPFTVNDFKYVIIDTDCGGDDAQALVLIDYFVKKQNKILLGITCTQGNASLNGVIKNVLIVQSVCGSSYPMYIGASSSMDGYTYKDYFFGLDGFGQVQDQYLKSVKLDESLVKKQKAYKFIAESAIKYKGEIAIICIAQFTNLALAYHYDNRIVDCFTNISFLGFSDTLGGLNHFYASQFNSALDPQAGYVIMNKFKNVILCTLDTTCFSMDDGPIQCIFKDYSTPKAKLIAKIHEFHYKKPINPLIVDPLSVLVLFAPQSVIAGRKIKINIHIKGQTCRGSSIVDYFSPESQNHNAYLVKTLDLNKIVEEVSNSYK